MADDPNIPRIGQAAQPKPAQAPQQAPGARQMTPQQQAGQVQSMAGARAAAQPRRPADSNTGVPGLWAPTLKQAGRTPPTVLDALVRLGYVGALALESAVAQAQASGITPEQVLMATKPSAPTSWR